MKSNLIIHRLKAIRLACHSSNAVSKLLPSIEMALRKSTSSSNSFQAGYKKATKLLRGFLFKE